MEPQENADYAKQSYWDERYAREEAYDWFGTVYEPCVSKTLDLLVAVGQRKLQLGLSATLTVLHLGVGNSNICADLEARFGAAWTSAGGDAGAVPRLLQIGMDYSPVVVVNMSAKFSSLRDRLRFVVGDIRNLTGMCATALRAELSDDATLLGELLDEASGRCTFDIVVDKATMDALQADKENENLDEDIEAMLRESSAHTRFAFAQMTWEIPYYRLHWTRRPEFVWGWMESEDATVPKPIEHCRLGDSDMYRYYIYRTRLLAGAPSA